MAKRLDACRSGKDFINYGTKHGAKIVRQNGSHVILATEKGMVPVPYHGAHDLGTGLRVKIVKAFVAIGVAVALLGIVVWGASAGGPAPSQQPSAPTGGTNGCLMWQFSPGGSPAFIEHRKETKMFGDLLAELALKAGLDRADAEDLRLKGNNYEMINAQLSALFSQRNVFTGDQDFLGAVRFTQGGVTVDENGINGGNGAVIIDPTGVFISNLGATNNLTTLNFGDVNNTRGTDIAIGVDTANRFIFGNRAANPKMRFSIVPQVSPTFKYAALDFLEDPSVADKYALHFYSYGVAEDQSIGVGPLTTPTEPYGIEVFGGHYNVGTSLPDGSAYIRLGIGAVTPPPNPHQDDTANIYIHNGKLVFQYNDGGTIRYKSLDLNGTGVTWVHSTTAP